jgi:uncharacterized protein (TIGR03118 family)
MHSRVGIICCGTALALAATASPASAAPPASTYRQVNLVADQTGKAAVTDPHLVNPWGMALGPTSPLWVSDNGTDLSTVYRGGVGGGPVSVTPLVVSIPGGAPTGQVFNDTTQFVVPGTTSPARFIFAGENGDLTAWNAGSSAVLVRHTASAVYKGLAVSHNSFGPLLLAANFHDNSVDVFDGQFRPVVQIGQKLFSDPGLPAGYAPFNIVEIAGKVFVTYAKQDADRHDDVPGPGNGYIDVYTTFGQFVQRFASAGALNSPWGLAVAPAGFGQLAGTLLVGNFGNGWINAYNLATDRPVGPMLDTTGKPIRIDGLWGLQVGTPTAGGPNAVWFSAGPDDEQHGLLGTLRLASG